MSMKNATMTARLRRPRGEDKAARAILHDGTAENHSAGIDAAMYFVRRLEVRSHFSTLAP